MVHPLGVGGGDGVLDPGHVDHADLGLGDYGGGSELAEDRVNMWPVFYWNDPAWAALWPLISSTEEGHAVVPFYEYHKGQQELRLGSVHHLVPAAAVLNKEKEYNRVLNVIHDGDDEWLAVLPLYYQNLDEDDPSVLIVPLLYKSKDALWTPLVTKTEDLTGVLGPLFFKRDDGSTNSYHFPWPFVAAWHGEDEGRSRLWPLYTYRRAYGYWHFDFLAYLGAMEKDGAERTSRLLPL